MRCHWRSSSSHNDLPVVWASPVVHWAEPSRWAASVSTAGIVDRVVPALLAGMLAVESEVGMNIPEMTAIVMDTLLVPGMLAAFAEHCP